GSAGQRVADEQSRSPREHRGAAAMVPGMRAIRRFTVRTVLPEPLAPLAELAANLRWSWHTPTRDLFAAVDQRQWEAVGGDPVRLLGAVRTERLAILASDDRFTARIA